MMSDEIDDGRVERPMTPALAAEEFAIDGEAIQVSLPNGVVATDFGIFVDGMPIEGIGRPGDLLAQPAPPRAPPRAPRVPGRGGPGDNSRQFGIEPAPERLYTDWADMPDDDFYAALRNLSRQGDAQVRIDDLKGAIRSLDPSYQFEPIVSAPGRGDYEGYLRDELGRVRTKFTLGGQSIELNGYGFRFDAEGRVTSVSGSLSLNRENTRNQAAQLRAGGLDRLTTDQGGHYIGRQFNGPTSEFNHFAQDSNFNMGAFRALEGQWARAIERGANVRVEITPSFSGRSSRPDFLGVRYRIDNGRWVSREFANRPGGK